MGLTGALLQAGARRPHVLVATMPGGTRVRLSVEDQLRRRSWPAATTPADADLLFMAGGHAPAHTGVVDQVWWAMPAPRARAQASDCRDVAAQLDAAQRQLADVAEQRWLRERQVGHGTGVDQHEGDGMDMPCGLSMADRGEDRDGLKLDQLHVSLGPFLPHWPAGLVLELTLQGDVIQHAAVGTVPEGTATGSFWTEPWLRAATGEHVTTGEAASRRAAAHLDSLGRLLAVAGWPDAAGTARRLRDQLLGSALPGGLSPAVIRFARRIARARTLRWLTAGLGGLSADDAIAADTGAALRAAGDVPGRYRRWCTDLVELAALLDDRSPLQTACVEPPRGQLTGGRAPSAGLLGLLPPLLTGAELGAARLIVASLDPDLDQLVALSAVGHGH